MWKSISFASDPGLSSRRPPTSSYLQLFTTLSGARERTIAIAGLVFAAAAGIPLPIIAIIYSKLISGFPVPEQQVQTGVVQLIGAAVAYFASTALYVSCFGMTGEHVSLKFRQRLIRSVLHLDQSYLDTHDIDIHTLLTEKIDTIHDACAEKAGITAQSVSYFVAALIVSFALDPKLAAILISTTIPSIALIVIIGSIATSKLLPRSIKPDERANGVAEGALRAVKTVQAFDMSSQLCANHYLLRSKAVRGKIRLGTIGAVRYGCIMFLIYAMNGFAFYLGGHLDSSEGLPRSAGEVFAVVLLIVDSSLVLALFVPYLEIFAKGASAGQEIISLDRIASSSAKLQLMERQTPRSLRGRPITFSDIEFSYPARPETQVLKGLSIKFLPGAVNAIIGPSGGGKSTIVSLLAGIYGFTGRISVDGDNISREGLASARDQIAVLDQEARLFTGDVYYNIACGVPDTVYSNVESELEQRCEYAARDAALDFVTDLAYGMRGQVGDGVELSGGQKQRICLARALVRRPALLILDEPTSALDAGTEKAVMGAVRRIANEGTTVIMIAHRLSTLQIADHISVINDGRLSAQGTYEELATCGSFLADTRDATETSAKQVTNLEEAAQCVTQRPVEKHALKFSTDSFGSWSGPESEEAALSFRRSLAMLYSFARPDVCCIVIGLVTSTVSGAILVGEALVFGNIIPLLDIVGESVRATDKLDLFCLLFSALACIALVSHTVSGTVFGIASSRAILRLQVEMLQSLLQSDAKWFAAPGRSVHGIMSMITKTTGDLACLSGTALGTILMAISSLVGCIILAHVTAWKIAVILLPAVPIMMTAGFARLRVIQLSEERRSQTHQRATEIAIEACRNRRTITTLGLERRILTQHHEALMKPCERSMASTICSSVILALSFTVTYLVYAFSYWWGSRLVRSGECTSRQYFVVMPAMLFSTQFTGQVFSLCPEIARAKAAAVAVCKLLNSQPHILERNSRPKWTPAGTQSPFNASIDPNIVQGISKVSFENVSFAYPTDPGKAVLRDVSLSVSKGQAVALVGPSGAGKSSLVALIERFYDPRTGNVKIDGSDLRSLDIRQIRERIGLVPQEAELFPGSIAYNIGLGRRRNQLITNEELEQVCVQCGLYEFVMSLPEKYETEVGSISGSKLSGGQRQRLALARALIRDPDILLLDEPTSALDTASERQIQGALARASKGRTTIVVAHRLASVLHADKIVVLDQGSVVEEGTHTDLMAAEGLYARMAMAQGLC